MEALRLTLEPSGWLVAVQAGRRGAYASGMLCDMYGGRQVYICRIGRRAARADLADTLDPADADDVVTVESQRAFYRRWRDSLPAAR